MSKETYTCQKRQENANFKRCADGCCGTSENVTKKLELCGQKPIQSRKNGKLLSDTYVVETAVEKRCGTREICGKRSHKVLKETDMVEQEKESCEERPTCYTLCLEGALVTNSISRTHLLHTHTRIV